MDDQKEVERLVKEAYGDSWFIQDGQQDPDRLNYIFKKRKKRKEKNDRPRIRQTLEEANKMLIERLGWPQNALVYYDHGTLIIAAQTEIVDRVPDDAIKING